MPIAKVQLPDGRIGRFEVPEGTTQEQVMQFARQNYKQKEEPQEEGFVEGVKSDIGEFKEGVTDIVKQPSLNPLANIGRYASESAGLVGDVAGRGLSAITPDVIEEPIKEVVQKGVEKIAGTAPVQAAVKGFQALPEDVQDIAGGVASVASLGGGASASKIASKQGLKTTGRVGESISSTISNPTKKIADSLLKVDPTLVKQFTQAGIEPTLLTATQSPTIKRLGSVLKGSFASTDIIQKNIENTLQGIEKGVGRLSNLKAGDITGQQAGEVIQKGITNYVDRFKTASTGLYNRLDRYVKPDDVADVSNTKKLLKDKFSKFVLEPNLQQSEISTQAIRILQDLVKDSDSQGIGYKALKGDQGIRYKALKTYRTKIGNLIKENAIAGKDVADAKQVYGAITQDMQSLVNSKGSKAIKAFDNANKFYQEGVNQIESRLQKYIGKQSDPALVFNQLKTGTKVGDVKAAAILRAVPKGDRELIRNSIVQQLGRKPDGDFSMSKFVTDYGRISKEGKNVLFGKAQQAYRKDLDNLADLSKQLRDSQEFTNFSRTADNLGNIGLISLGVGNLAAGAAAAAGINTTSRLITNPKFVKALSNSINKPVSQGNVNKFFKNMKNVAIESPDIKEDIAQYIALTGALMTESMENQ